MKLYQLNPSLLPTPTPIVLSEFEKREQLALEWQAQTSKSDGMLVFPKTGTLIADDQPTIIAKFKQDETLILPHALVTDTFNAPYGDYETLLRALTFTPGNTQNILIELDGRPITRMHGFAQYPYIICQGRDQRETSPTQNYSIPECLTNNAENIPPAHVFFKPTQKLATGLHEVVYTIGDKKFNYSFAVDPTATFTPPVLPTQFKPEYPHNSTSFINEIKEILIPTAQAGHDNPERNMIDDELYKLADKSNTFYDLIGAPDSCGAGYWYTGNLLATPLAKIPQENVYYTLHLPKIFEEFGAPASTQVGLKFGSIIYDVHLPDYYSFYFASEFTTTLVHAQDAFYLPFNNLVYQQTNTPVSSYTKEYLDVLSAYLEYLPHDYAGNAYPANILLHQVSYSSGCDG